MKASTAKPNATAPKKPSAVAIVLGIVVTAGLIWGGVMMFNAKSTNYAEEVARPLEKALVEAGAVKKCSRGDAGRGSDNRQPWYQGYFEISKNEGQAIDIADRVAAEHGYSLTHAMPTHRGPLGVADQFIDKWYFDNTSKDNSYKDLNEGPINLMAQVNADGIEKVCSEGMTLDASHSAIGVEVRLPPFKQQNPH